MTMKIVALDNDETIGSWGQLSSIYIKILQKTGVIPDYETFSKIAEEAVCIRPHLEELYTYLLDLRSTGVISKIVMFTAASDSNGWVTYLRNMLEAWYSRKTGNHTAIYDYVVSGEMITSWYNKHLLPGLSNQGMFKYTNLIRHLISNDTSTCATAVPSINEYMKVLQLYVERELDADLLEGAYETEADSSKGVSSIDDLYIDKICTIAATDAKVEVYVVDDRPHNIRDHTEVIPVFPYCVALNLVPIFEKYYPQYDFREYYGAFELNFFSCKRQYRAFLRNSDHEHDLVQVIDKFKSIFSSR